MLTDNKKSVSSNIGKTFSLVAILTVLSKFIGLVRDIIVAHAYGTGIIADAYNYAYLFTGNILILFGGLGGPFHSSTVAVIGSRKSEENVGRLVCQVTIITFFALLVVTAIAYFIAPFVIQLMSSNYVIDINSLPQVLRTHNKSDLQAIFRKELYEQFVIMLPLIIISGLVGISYGVLNVKNRIFWPSLSPAIASIAIIIAVLGFAKPETVAFTGIPLAMGTLIGAVGQLLAQLPDLFDKKKTQINYRISLKPESGLKEYSAMIWPAIFSTSVGQLTVYIDGFFTLSNLGQGAWTAILMSNRLVQLPLGVLLTAMLVPILPKFTEQVRDKQIESLKSELRKSLRFLWFLALPLTVMFFCIPEPIIQLLFEHGQFNSESTRIVSNALIFLAPSIFFYVARDLLTRVFYAFQDSKTPYYIALIAIITKALLDWYLVTQTSLGVGAISLASTLITILNLTLLAWFLKKRIGSLGSSYLIKPLIIMISASILCGLCTRLLASLLLNNNFNHDLIHGLLNTLLPSSSINFILLGLSIFLSAGFGAIIYFIVCLVFRLEEPRMLLQRVPVLNKLTKFRI